MEAAVTEGRSSCKRHKWQNLLALLTWLNWCYIDWWLMLNKIWAPFCQDFSIRNWRNTQPKIWKAFYFLNVPPYNTIMDLTVPTRLPCGHLSISAFNSSTKLFHSVPWSDEGWPLPHPGLHKKASEQLPPGRGMFAVWEPAFIETTNTYRVVSTLQG